jgi:hypothetical protein
MEKPIPSVHVEVDQLATVPTYPILLLAQMNRDFFCVALAPA